MPCSGYPQFVAACQTGQAEATGATQIEASDVVHLIRCLVDPVDLPVTARQEGHQAGRSIGSLPEVPGRPSARPSPRCLTPQTQSQSSRLELTLFEATPDRCE
jgi:hypothetical protein